MEAWTDGTLYTPQIPVTIGIRLISTSEVVIQNEMAAEMEFALTNTISGVLIEKTSRAVKLIRQPNINNEWTVQNIFTLSKLNDGEYLMAITLANTECRKLIVADVPIRVVDRD